MNGVGTKVGATHRWRRAAPRNNIRVGGSEDSGFDHDLLQCLPVSFGQRTHGQARRTAIILAEQVKRRLIEEIKNNHLLMVMRTQMGAVYDSGDYEKALNQALKNADWKGLQAQRDKMRAEGRLVGLGLAMYVEVCGIGPSASLPTGGWEHSQVTIERDGHISATTGASPHGQGNETTFAQMLADQFSVPFEHVTIQHGDTGVVKQGIGTFGSRSQAVGGTALHMAGTKAKAKMAKFARPGFRMRPPPRFRRQSATIPAAWVQRHLKRCHQRT